jgi:hypothetical protein
MEVRILADQDVKSKNACRAMQTRQSNRVNR